MKSCVQCVQLWRCHQLSPSLFLADGVVTPFALSKFSDLTSHGRRRVVLAAQSSPGFQAVAFACVSDDPVGCVGCKGHKVCVELSNETVDLDLVLLIGTFSKDIDPGYEAVSLRRSLTLDNDFPLT